MFVSLLQYIYMVQKTSDAKFLIENLIISKACPIYLSGREFGIGVCELEWTEGEKMLANRLREYDIGIRVKVIKPMR